MRPHVSSDQDFFEKDLTFLFLLSLPIDSECKILSTASIDTGTMTLEAFGDWDLEVARIAAAFSFQLSVTKILK